MKPLEGDGDSASGLLLKTETDCPGEDGTNLAEA